MRTVHHVITGMVATVIMAAGSTFEVADQWEVGRVPAGFPVRFCLLTHGDRQYVAYYDEQHRMTIAARELDSDRWQRRVLPSTVGWDSHNSITMAADDDGTLHLAGNMHCDPLVYFRTAKPGDITSFERLPMTGEREQRATYPKFLRDHRGRLIFNYRDGGSGRGVRLYNQYDERTHTWSRLVDHPLLDGEGECNAYPMGPVRGPDGWFHMHWVWRDTPDCATNHHLSYARSKDLVQWESAFGKPVALPITIGQKELWIDPVPAGGGLINGGSKLAFDSKGRPLVNYHKADGRGNMQVYVARPEGGKWRSQVLTDWDKPVPFSGRGSMTFIGIAISGIEEAAPGLLTMAWRHRDFGSGRLFIDEASLKPVKRAVKVPPAYPREMNHNPRRADGLSIRRAEDIGDPGSDGVRYVLQWHTRPPNHDRKPDGPVPAPSTLILYKLVAGGGPR